MTDRPSSVKDFFQLQWRLAKSLAASDSYNPRNLEFPWYGLWQLVLNYVVWGRPDFVVFPQFPLYYQTRDVVLSQVPPDQPGQEDVIVEVHDVAVDQHPRNRRDKVKNDLPANPPSIPILQQLECDIDSDTNASTSTEESIQEEPIYSSTCIPDFAVVHHCAVPSLLRSLRESRYDALGQPELQITHGCCPIIAEIKTSADREAPEDILPLRRGVKFDEAYAGLLSQCRHYFQMFPKATSVIAIAASGAHWTHRIVKRSEFCKKTTDDQDATGDVAMEGVNGVEEGEVGAKEGAKEMEGEEEHDVEMEDSNKAEEPEVDEYDGVFNESDINKNPLGDNSGEDSSIDFEASGSSWNSEENAKRDKADLKREAKAKVEDSFHPEDEKQPDPQLPKFSSGWSPLLEIGTRASDVALDILRDLVFVTETLDVPNIGADGHPVKKDEQPPADT
ncbi:hypothetical protein SCHPADRAFT_943819 [Schizopora paradoxa]|uniref:Uncharacterized protein n=1 Tax=Schizopora paradoxa TaxID=27342 RepID=A0A0H2RBH6_9AGAM|nr:hypothetical protein SCHPADRAFT_943819 [Schizopora paradoxa]